MIEGKVTFFKNYEIIEGNNKNFHIYDIHKRELAVCYTLVVAKDWIINKISGNRLESLKHDGVIVIGYEINNYIYILSLKNEILKLYPNFREILLSYSYNDYKTAQECEKLIHNELGPANIGVETGLEQYFWNGIKMTKEQWEKEIRNKNFKNTLNNILEEEK